MFLVSVVRCVFAIGRSLVQSVEYLNVISKHQQRGGLDPTRGLSSHTKNGVIFGLKLVQRSEQKLTVISNILKLNLSL